MKHTQEHYSCWAEDNRTWESPERPAGAGCTAPNCSDKQTRMWTHGTSTDGRDISSVPDPHRRRVGRGSGGEGAKNDPVLGIVLFGIPCFILSISPFAIHHE